MSALEGDLRDKSGFAGFWGSVKSFPRDLTFSASFTGLLLVAIACTGPIAILLEAAKVGNLTPLQTASWICTSFVGSGIYGIALSLWFRIPMIGAFSTPSVALMIVGFTTHSIREAVGAYFIAALATIFVGVTGLLDRILKVIPRPVILAMLGGILFQFGLSIFTELPSAPLIVIAMIAGYFIARRMGWRAPVITSLILAFPITALTHRFNHLRFHFDLVHPTWINPTFSLSALITLAFPMFLLTLTSQYATGMAVLKNDGFAQPVNASLVTGGTFSLLSAGFLNSGINSAAIIAAIGTGEHAEPDKKRRYTVGVMCGIFYIIVGSLGSTMLNLFAILPAALIATLGGLALLPAIASSTWGALENAEYREAALITFLITISGIHPWNLGSSFWGLVAGVVVHYILAFNIKSKK
jgi:benzoate membrane transport protein